ncbi:hypothetical protein L6452_02583 [Arctium lappa]|uniref:Uncharacterized protein n=1 Tax=Arctium lappa TaxID=4217 RepID=A0ACB9FJG8_ARCLA|nr:hypothetical protein L6452_02583 [Arctium lappa]
MLYNPDCYVWNYMWGSQEFFVSGFPTDHGPMVIRRLKLILHFLMEPWPELQYLAVLQQAILGSWMIGLLPTNLWTLQFYPASSTSQCLEKGFQKMGLVD